jgi:group II intron reverse transcriptase/maturase
MKFAGQKECGLNNSLFPVEVPVWYGSRGEVSPTWLSVCTEERHRTKDLMERIAHPSNLQKACKQVVQNGGSAGIDKMSVGELKQWMITNITTLSNQLIDGTFKAQPTREVLIPKPQGGTRQLGIPTVIDRLVQQAISQELNTIYDPSFSPNSFGFRPNRGAHHALKRATEYLQEGKTTIVDIDLEKFFDKVNHDRLMWLLGTRIGDKKVLRLINQFLQTGILRDGMVEQRIQGTPQGSPLSPLLSNIVLDELDQELHRRNLSFVRYADDMLIFVKHKDKAERVQVQITEVIEKRMKLKVNESKSGVRQRSKVVFLGHTFLSKGRLGVSQKNEDRFKAKLKVMTQRNRGESLETIIKQLTSVMRGWLNYFQYATMKSRMERIDGWLRRRLKCFRLKQCKRCIGIVRFLRKLGVEETLCWRTGLSGKGWWRLSKSPATNIGMNNRWFEEQGYYSLKSNYQKLHCNSL